MLVPFTDSEGREVWVNPIHVKAVRVRKGLLGGKKGSDIWFSWQTSSESIAIPLEPSEVAAALNAAMPAVMLPAPVSDEDEDEDSKT